MCINTHKTFLKQKLTVCATLEVSSVKNCYDPGDLGKEIKACMEHNNTVRSGYNMPLYSVDFNIMRSELGSTIGAYSIITRATITESAIFEASQANWDTFNCYVCLRGISVYYFKVSQFFARFINEKVVGR